MIQHIALVSKHHDPPILCLASDADYSVELRRMSQIQEYDIRLYRTAMTVSVPVRLGVETTTPHDIYYGDQDAQHTALPICIRRPSGCSSHTLVPAKSIPDPTCSPSDGQGLILVGKRKSS